MVISMKAKKLQWKSSWVHYQVSEDLSGKCFNCFSPTHLARHCCLRTRCFRCFAMGHRAVICSDVVDGANLPAAHGSFWSRLRCNVLVWSRLKPPVAPRQNRKMVVSVWRRISPPLVAHGESWGNVRALRLPPRWHWSRCLPMITLLMCHLPQ